MKVKEIQELLDNMSTEELQANVDGFEKISPEITGAFWGLSNVKDMAAATLSKRDVKKK